MKPFSVLSLLFIATGIMTYELNRNAGEYAELVPDGIHQFIYQHYFRICRNGKKRSRKVKVHVNYDGLSAAWGYHMG